MTLPRQNLAVLVTEFRSGHWRSRGRQERVQGDGPGGSNGPEGHHEELIDLKLLAGEDSFFQGVDMVE